MKRICKLMLGLVFSASFGMAQATQVSIGFWNPSLAGTAIGNYFEAADGVVFTQAYFTNQVFASGEAAGTTTNNVLNVPIFGYFSTGVTDYLETVSWYADTGTTTTLSAYDVNHILLGSMSSIGQPALKVSMPGIKYFEITFSNTINGRDDVVGINHLIFNTPTPVLVDQTVPEPKSVPEPTVLALLGVGLAAMRLSRRKKEAS